MYEFVRGNPGSFVDPHGLNAGALNLGLGMGGGLQNLGSRLPKEELNVEIKEGAQQEASGNNREAQPQESGIISTPIPEQESGIISTPIPEQESGIISTPIPEQESGIISTPIPEQESGIISTPIPEQKPGDNIYTKEDGDNIAKDTEKEAGNKGTANQPKQGVKLGEYGTFEDLKKRSKGSGLEIHEEPSRKAQEKKYIRDFTEEHGRPPTKQEIEKNRGKNPSIALTPEIHSHTDTYKGRNTGKKSSQDSHNLDGAARRGAKSIIKGAEKEGFNLEDQVKNFLKHFFG